MLVDRPQERPPVRESPHCCWSEVLFWSGRRDSNPRPPPWRCCCAEFCDLRRRAIWPVSCASSFACTGVISRCCAVAHGTPAGPPARRLMNTPPPPPCFIRPAQAHDSRGRTGLEQQLCPGSRGGRRVTNSATSPANVVDEHRVSDLIIAPTPPARPPVPVTLRLSARRPCPNSRRSLPRGRDVEGRLARRGRDVEGRLARRFGRARHTRARSRLHHRSA